MASLSLFISCVVTFPTTFSFSGSTQLSQPNVGNYSGIQFYSNGSCTVNENDTLTSFFVAFNVYIDSSNESYYFVKGQATSDSFFYIYTNWNPNEPCEGLYDYGEFTNYVDGIDVFDGVNLVEGTYTIVATSIVESFFAIEFSPATTVLPFQSDLPSYEASTLPAYYDGSCLYRFNPGPTLNYNTFTWTPPTSAYFDIYGIAINSSYIYPSSNRDYILYLSLYNGPLFGYTYENPCQPNFVNGVEGSNIVSGLDYIWLNAGQTYTFVFTISGLFGSVALQIVPSNLFFVGSNTFAPIRENSTLSDCNTQTDTLTSWTSYTLTAQYPVFVITALSPLNQNYYGYFDYNNWGSFNPYFYLYSGNLNSTPADTCTDLLQFNQFEVGGQSTVGENYTVVITDYTNSPSLSYYYTAFHLFIFTGPYVNTATFVVSPSTTGSDLSFSGTTTSSVSSNTTSSVIDTTTGFDQSTSSSSVSTTTTESIPTTGTVSSESQTTTGAITDTTTDSISSSSISSSVSTTTESVELSSVSTIGAVSSVSGSTGLVTSESPTTTSSASITTVTSTSTGVVTVETTCIEGTTASVKGTTATTGTTTIKGTTSSLVTNGTSTSATTSTTGIKGTTTGVNGTTGTTTTTTVKVNETTGTTHLSTTESDRVFSGSSSTFISLFVGMLATFVLFF